MRYANIQDTEYTDLLTSPEEPSTLTSEATESMIVNTYVVPSGSWLSGIHAHLDQDETFIACRGIAQFETLEDTYELRPGEVIHFDRGEYQGARNTSGETIILAGIGSPPHTEQLRIPLYCQDCSSSGLEPFLKDGKEMLRCPNCDYTESAACEQCGKFSKIVGKDGNSELVSLCQECGMTAPR